MDPQNIGVKNADTQEHIILHDVALTFRKQYSIVDQTHFSQREFQCFGKKYVCYESPYYNGIKVIIPCPSWHVDYTITPTYYTHYMWQRYSLVKYSSLFETGGKT